MSPVGQALLAIVLLVAGGLPLGYAATRSLPLAVLLAPLASALLASAAIIVMLFAGGPLWFWLLAVFLAGCAPVPVLLRRHRVPEVSGLRTLAADVEPLPHGSWVDALWLAVPLLPPFLRVLAPPMAWDSHSIWWLHAAYFTKGAGYARDAIGNPMFAFSHTDYPPVLSAPVAAAWTVFPGHDLYLAQAVSALVTFSAITMLGYAVRRITGRAPALAARLAGAGVSLATWSVAPLMVANGYSDALWGAALVAGAVLLLNGREPLVRPTLALVLLAVAGLAKNEGLLMVVVVAGLFTLRERRRPRTAWIVWVPVAAGAVWALTARVFGAQSDLLADRQADELLTGNASLLSRLRQILAALWTTVGPAVAIALAVALLGGVLLRRARRDLGIGSDLWLWAANSAYGVMLVITLLNTPYDLAWHLSTSVNRVSVPIALMASASVACWAVTAIRSQPAQPPAPVSGPAPPAAPRSFAPLPALPAAVPD